MKFSEKKKEDLKQQVLRVRMVEARDPVQKERLCEAIDKTIEVLAKTQSWSTAKSIIEKMPGILEDLYEIIKI